MGNSMTFKTGGKLEATTTEPTLPFENTIYDKPGMTVEAHALLNSANRDYNEHFDLIDELLGARVGPGARDLRIRYDTFLRRREEGGILVGYAAAKLRQNRDEFNAGTAPTPPQAGEPGSELAKGGGYEGWFGHLIWYNERAENLDTRAGGKLENIADLEKRPSDSDIEKLPDGEFGKLYGFTKEEFLQKDGVTFEKKHGGDKLWFLRNRVMKRLSWEENMMLKEVENSIYTHSTNYGPLADAPTASGIVSHVAGVSCGEKVDLLELDRQARKAGAILDTDGEDREKYWQQVDAKLKDARYMNDAEFTKKWTVSKETFIDDIVPKLFKVYDGVIANTVACKDVEWLKNRYYLSELRGDELIGELLGGTHSVKERVNELEVQRNKLTRYMTGFSKMREDFEKKVEGRDELRDKRLVGLKHEMLELEHARPEIAAVGEDIFETHAGEQIVNGPSEGKTASTNWKTALYNLKGGKDNPYLTYMGYRDELKDEKKKIDELGAELANLKNTLEKINVSSLEFGAVKALLDKVEEKESGTSKGYFEKELKLDKLEKLEARRKKIWENAPRLDGGGSATEEDNEKWGLWKQKVAEQEKLVLPEINAAKEKWRGRALRVIETELENNNALSVRLSPDIEMVEGEISYFEKKLGIEYYNRLKARQREMETEFPVGDKSKSARIKVIRKLAFDALAKAEEKIGKEEYRKLEERRKELKENVDPALMEAALKEIGIIEERLGLAPYKKLEERREKIESEIERRLGTGVYKWIKARKEELEQLIDVTERDTNKEYRAFKAHGEKLEKKIRKDAIGEIETLEKALGITEYTDLESAESRLTDSIKDMTDNQKIPSEIETKRKEIESKEDSLEKLVGEIEDLENKFGIQGYAKAGLLGERIRYLKENLPRDPQLRKIALAGVKSSTGNDPNSKGVSITGVNDIEHAFESAKYEKNKLEKEIMALEGKLSANPQLELQELETIEKTEEQLRLAKANWMATHGVAAFEKWKDEHGANAYKRLVDEERLIEKTRTNDYWALKDAHDTTVKVNVTLNAVDSELGYLKTRLADDRQLPELRDMLWGRGKYSDAPVSMAVFNGLYKEIEAQLPEESKRLVGIVRENIKKRTEWMGSHPSVREQKRLAEERAAFEFEASLKLSQNRHFCWNTLVAESGDMSEFGEFLKKGFGIELPKDARIDTDAGGRTSLTMSESGLVVNMADNGKTVNVCHGDKPVLSVSLYNRDELAMLETADGKVIEKLMAKRNPKTGELVIFPYVQSDIIMKKKMYEEAHKKKRESRE